MERKPSIRGLVVAEPTSFAEPTSDSELLESQMIDLPKPGEEILGGKYEIERVIGVGGMGVVVSAIHKKLGQRVALKFLARSMQTPELVDRFLREGQACVRIKSEHIASVLDVGVLDNGTPYLMMEYLEGVDLDDYITDRGALPIDDAVDFILQACDALAVAHSAGVVHRDLKPSNLFVTQRSDGSPLIKVLDFGISKIGQTANHPEAKMSLTRPGTMLGSPRYMSPEQLRNASGVDHRADIWAMGIVLHELIAGTPPYVADTFADLCVMITTETPTPLRALVPEAPELLELVILKCIAKDPADRWQNVAELASALVPLASDESRVIAIRVSKIVGLIPSKTPAGAYTSSRMLGPATPRPRARADASGNARRSDASDPTLARRSVPNSISSGAGGGFPTDPNVAALAVSSVEAGKGRGARYGTLLAIVALFAVVAATVLVVRRPATHSTVPVSAAATIAAPAVPTSATATVAPPEPAPPPPVVATTAVTPPPVATATAPAPAPRGKPKARPASSAGNAVPASTQGAQTPAPPTPTSAPASESDMLNRRH